MNKKPGYKRKKWIVLGIVAVLIVAGFVIFGGKKQAAGNTFTVKRGTVTSEVSVTGKVVPVTNIDLAFNQTGRVNHVYVKVGDKVSRGQTLITLDNADLVAQVAQAEATVSSQQATLDSLEKGTRPEEIQVQRAAVAKAEQDLQNYYTGIYDLVNDAYAKADDAVHNQTSALFTNGDSKTPELTFQVSDSQARVDIVSLRIRSVEELNAWKSELATLSSSSSDTVLHDALDKGQAHLAIVRSYLASALNAVNNNTGLSDTTASGYRTSIYTGRTNVITSYTALSTREQTIASQELTVKQLQDQLALDLAGSTPEQIAAQKAQVMQAEANVQYYQSQLAKTILRAPFSGTVTKMDLVSGDVVTANAPVVSLIGAGKFEIEAYIAESDIAKVSIGNTASVTLDAYGKDVVFTAKVIKIDLSETILDGVATYKTTLQFDTEDQRVLPGLTANVDILSAKKENVLYVPTRDIATEGDKKIVKKIVDTTKGTTEDTEITVGIRGSDGNTEVLSGLNEGDSILSD